MRGQFSCLHPVTIILPCRLQSAAGSSQSEAISLAAFLMSSSWPMAFNLPWLRPRLVSGLNILKGIKIRRTTQNAQALTLHAGHLQKALSFSPSLFISISIHSGALGRRPSDAPGHSCRVPPPIATRLTPLTQHMEAPTSSEPHQRRESSKFKSGQQPEGRGREGETATQKKSSGEVVLELLRTPVGSFFFFLSEVNNSLITNNISGKKKPELHCKERLSTSGLHTQASSSVAEPSCQH